MVPLRGLTNERSPTRDQAKLRARGIIVQRGLNCHGSLKPASIVHKFLASDFFFHLSSSDPAVSCSRGLQSPRAKLKLHLQIRMEKGLNPLI